MTKSTSAIVIALTLVPGLSAYAQPPKPPAAPGSIVPLRVQVVISTYQGEKKISSVPYTLSVNAGPGGPFGASGPFGPAQSQLRMGVKVPIPSLMPPTVDGKRLEGLPTGGGPVIYQDIGTNIDCTALTMEDGRFQLQISIEDESLADVKGTNRPGEPPVIRSFRLSNQVILRDGQSTQFTAATDRVTGEVIRVEVTASIAK